MTVAGWVEPNLHLGDRWYPSSQQMISYFYYLKGDRGSTSPELLLMKWQQRSWVCFCFLEGGRNALLNSDQSIIQIDNANISHGDRQTRVRGRNKKRQMCKEGGAAAAVFNRKEVGLKGKKCSPFINRKRWALGQIIKDHGPISI
jgi:hypothetical protein